MAAQENPSQLKGSRFPERARGAMMTPGTDREVNIWLNRLRPVAST